MKDEYLNAEKASSYSDAEILAMLARIFNLGSGIAKHGSRV